MNKDYRYFDFDDSDLSGIEILTGPYADVVYYYTNASINEQGYGATLKFGYQIVKSGKHDRRTLDEDQNFVTMLGDILSEIILTEKTQIEPSRTLYSEESDI